MNIKNILNNSKNIDRLIRRVKKRPIPEHVAIIMDGNGRWAQSRGLAREVGHRYGSEALKEIVKVSVKLDLDYLTLFAFSTENWQRPQKEIDALMDLLVDFLHAELGELHDNNIQLNVLGNWMEFPDHVKREIEVALKTTSSNSGLRLNIALNYGGRADILRAIRKIVDDVKMGKLHRDEIDEENFNKYLYTLDMPDPDLLIRTSGEYRISNFLLYQMAYTELWFSKPSLLWPDFNQREFLKAILDYQSRKRKFGGLM